MKQAPGSEQDQTLQNTADCSGYDFIENCHDWFRSTLASSITAKPSTHQRSRGMHSSAASLLRNTTSLRLNLSASTSKRCLQRTRRVCSASKDLPAPDVQKLAQLAHISVTEQQARIVGLTVAANSRRVLSRLYICSAGPGLGAQASKHSTMVCLDFGSAHAARHADWCTLCVDCRFGQLQQADVTGIEPAVRADVQADNALRDDVPQESANRSVAVQFGFDREFGHMTLDYSNAVMLPAGRT